MPTNMTISPGKHERQIETQLNDLEARLRHEYGDRPGGGDKVHDVLVALRDRYADARIRTFLPILIERAARTKLAAMNCQLG